MKKKNKIMNRILMLCRSSMPRTPVTRMYVYILLHRLGKNKNIIIVYALDYNDLNVYTFIVISFLQSRICANEKTRQMCNAKQLFSKHKQKMLFQLYADGNLTLISALSSIIIQRVILNTMVMGVYLDDILICV